MITSCLHQLPSKGVSRFHLTCARLCQSMYCNCQAHASPAPILYLHNQACVCQQAMKADGRKKTAAAVLSAIKGGNKQLINVHAQEGQALTSSLSGQYRFQVKLHSIYIHLFSIVTPSSLLERLILLSKKHLCICACQSEACLHSCTPAIVHSIGWKCKSNISAVSRQPWGENACSLWLCGAYSTPRMQQHYATFLL